MESVFGPTLNTPPVITPWGYADNIESVAEGIDFVSTPSHGGYRLSDDREEQVQKAFPGFKPFAGNWKGWYEEDCDWCVVVLTFPTLFIDDEIAQARKMRDWQIKRKV